MIAFYLHSPLANISSTHLGLAVFVVFALAAGVLAVLKITDRIRGRKPCADDLQTFTTKIEHYALVKRVDKIEDDNSFQTRATQRALGRIEGKIDTLDS